MRGAKVEYRRRFPTTVARDQNPDDDDDDSRGESPGDRRSVALRPLATRSDVDERRRRQTLFAPQPRELLLEIAIVGLRHGRRIPSSSRNRCLPRS